MIPKFPSFKYHFKITQHVNVKHNEFDIVISLPYNSFTYFSLHLQGRTVDLKTLTLIEDDPAEEGAEGEDEQPGDNTDAEFERILKESGE